MTNLTTTTTNPIPLGVYVGTDNADTPALVASYTASISSFATLMGEQPLFTDTGANSNDPESGWLGDAQWDANNWANTPVARAMTPVIILPFASFAAGSETGDQMFQDFVAGKYDSMITGSVQAWAKAGATTQYWRPGWEMNLLSSMPWYAGNSAQAAADYVAAFQHVYTVLHQAGTANGVNIQVIWNPGTTNYGAVNTTTALFPGANYVDAIGADVYQIDNPTQSEIANGQATTLQMLLNLAASTGKPFVIPEAGNSTNSAAFAQWMAQTLAQSSATVSFVNLWDSGSYAFTGSAATQPALAAAFAEYFGANAINPLVGSIAGSVLNGSTALAGLTVSLLSNGAVIATTTTSSTGAFSFASLNPGTYQVQYTAPSGLVLQSGSQANITTGQSAPITVGIAQAVSLPAELMLANPGTIQSTVLHFSASTDPVGGSLEAGVTVSLLNSSGSVIATTLSNSAGAVSFGNLGAGTYQLQYTAPAGQGVEPGTNATSVPITVAAGQTVIAPSGDIITLGSISGSALLAGVGDAGVSVALLNSAGTSVATTTTAADGTFSFSNVMPGSYTVQYKAPSGQLLQTGSQANISTGVTAPFSVTASQNTSLPAELLLTSAGAATIQVQTKHFYGPTDPTWGGIDPGVVTQLLNSAGQVIATGATNSTAAWLAFSNLAPGTYRVQYQIPTGQALLAGTTALTAPITVAAGAGPFAPNGQFISLGSIGGSVTAGGAAVAGMSLNLLSSTGTTLATTTTGSTGAYSFANLAAGNYEVQYTAPQGLILQSGSTANAATGLTPMQTLGIGQTLTLANETLLPAPATLSGAVTFAAAAYAGETVTLLSTSGATLATTTTNSAGNFQFASLAAGSYEIEYSDTPATQVFSSGPASTATGITSAISLAAGQTLAIATEDLEAAPATLTGSVSYAGAGDAGLAISLIGSGGATVATTTTASDGSFQFTGLAAGTYQVQYSDNATTQLYGTGPASSTTGLSSAVSLTAGQTLALAAETLLPAPASITGSVTYAGAADGGIAISLLNAAGTTIATTTTSATGNFAFSGLSAGSYTVQYSGNATQVLGSGPASGTTGLTAAVTLTPGQVLTLAAETMLPAPATLSGSLTYLGVAESGVAVALLNTAGMVQATSATDVNGNFTFSGLAAGAYDVQYGTPFGQMLGSGPAGSNGITAAQTLTPGQTLTLAPENLLTSYATLSGSVQISKTGSSPSGAAGEDVSLLNNAGTVVATTVSQNNGYFQFTGITAGTYSVQYVSPSGAVAALGGAANPATGQTGAISLAPGQNVALATQQLLSTPASITATVDWRSLTNWGQSGATVELLSSTGSVLATGVTNTAGTVTFGGLVAGSYALDYLTPAGATIYSGPSGINAATGVTGAIAVAAGAKVTEGLELLSPASTSTLVAYEYTKNAAGVSTALANQTVTLLDAAGNTLVSEATNAWGGVAFLYLNAGTYQIRYSAPSGYNLQAGSAANPTTGVTSPITLAAGQSLTVTPETFVAASGVVSGSVQTSSGGTPAALAGVTVALLNAAGTVVGSTVSSSTGSFQFSSLAAGSYQVQYTAPSGQSLALGSLANPSTGLTSAISVGTGQTVGLAAEQMLSLPGTISGVVQHNGSGDPGTGQSGVSVSLLNAAGTTIGTTTTSGTGSYSFANLAAGSYQLLYGAPSGEAIMAGFAADPTSGLSSTVTLAAGASLAMGVVELASTSNLFSLTGSGAAAVRGAGNFTVTGNASGGSLVLGAGNQSISLTGGNDTITTGAGNSTISALAGGNTITAGAGMNFITVDAATGNVFNLNNGAGGTTSISGFNTTGDVLDLKTTLAGLTIAANLSNLGSYVTATVSNGSTTLAVNPTPGAGSPVNFAILNGVNTSVTQLITNNAFSLS